MFKFTLKIFEVLISYCITIITLPPFLILLSFFFMFKKLIFVYLKLKHRRQFGGMVDSSDSLWLVGSPQKNVTDIVLIANRDLNNPIDVTLEAKTIIQKNIMDNVEKLPKLSSTIHSCCGYGYLLRKDLDIDKCIIAVTVKENSENYFKTCEEIIAEISNEELPYDNKFLWQLIIITGPREWKLRQNIKENQLYFWLRLHHVFGDGVSAVKVFTGWYSDGTEDVSQSFKKVLSKFVIKKNFIQKILENVHLFMLLPGFVILKRFQGDPGLPDIAREKLEGNSKLFFKIDKDDSIFHCVKRIKNTIGDTAFVEVILTSISASLEKYYRNNGEIIPEVVTIGVPIIVNMKEARNIDSKKLENSFGIILAHLPILVKSASLLERLTEVKKNFREIINTPDNKIPHLLFNYILGLIPLEIVKYLANLENFGMCFSNFPGLPKLRAANGEPLEHLIFFPPIRGSVGVATALITYNDKIHFSLRINEEIMTNKKDCQRMIDDIFQFIRLLDEEVSMERSPTEFISIKL